MRSPVVLGIRHLLIIEIVLSIIDAYGVRVV